MKIAHEEVKIHPSADCFALKQSDNGVAVAPEY